MPVPTYNYTWGQGEDLIISLIYKTGPVGLETPVDLTGYSLRMDVADSTGRLFTFNSDDIDEPAADVVGPADNEATLGADGSINIVVPRSLTLPGGAVYDNIVAENNVFFYDIFLRDTFDKQRKILRGQITVEPSYTLWA